MIKDGNRKECGTEWNNRRSAVTITAIGLFCDAVSHAKVSEICDMVGYL